MLTNVNFFRQALKLLLLCWVVLWARHRLLVNSMVDSEGIQYCHGASSLMLLNLGEHFVCTLSISILITLFQKGASRCSHFCFGLNRVADLQSDNQLEKLDVLSPGKHAVLANRDVDFVR